MQGKSVRTATRAKSTNAKADSIRIRGRNRTAQVRAAPKCCAKPANAGSTRREFKAPISRIGTIKTSLVSSTRP